MGSGKGKREDDQGGKRKDPTRPSRSELRRRLEEAEARAVAAEQRAARAKKRAKRAEKLARRAEQHAALAHELVKRGATGPETGPPAQQPSAAEGVATATDRDAERRPSLEGAPRRPEIGSPADLRERLAPRSPGQPRSPEADPRRSWIGHDPRSRWIHEDDLGQARMNWFVTAQALLFVPFAVGEAPALIYTLPFVGVGLSWMLAAGLRACGAAMERLRREDLAVETIPGGLPAFGVLWSFGPALLFQTAWVVLLLDAVDHPVLALVAAPLLAALLVGFVRAVVPDGTTRP